LGTGLPAETSGGPPRPLVSSGRRRPVGGYGQESPSGGLLGAKRRPEAAAAPVPFESRTTNGNSSTSLVLTVPCRATTLSR
jgi:hypothetical protein